MHKKTEIDSTHGFHVGQLIKIKKNYFDCFIEEKENCSKSYDEQLLFQLQSNDLGIVLKINSLSEIFEFEFLLLTKYGCGWTSYMDTNIMDMEIELVET